MKIVTFFSMAEYSISKCIRTDKPVKKNGKYPIYLRIRVKDKETKVPVNIDIEKEKWDAKKKEPKDKSLYVLLNKRISEIEININRELADDKPLTLELIKDLIAGKKRAKPENGSFYDYYLPFIERKKRENIHPETIRIYNTTYHILKEFAPEFKISDINLQFVEDFDDYMRDVRGNANGGRELKHKNLRAAIIDMQKHDIDIKNPYLHFKIPKSSVKDVYLEFKELDSLRMLRPKFHRETKEHRILQMYLFSCYTGLRYSDVFDLKWNQIDFDSEMIQKIMVKTKENVIVPIYPMARAVLLELSDSKKLLGTNLYVFKKYSESTVNKTIKKLCERAGITKHISYHSSRHTFATLAIMNGASIYTISKYLGHKSITMTERYLKYDLGIAKEAASEISIFGTSKKYLEKNLQE